VSRFTPPLTAYAPWTEDRAHTLFDRRIVLRLEQEQVAARAKISMRALKALESDGTRFIKASDLAAVCRVLRLHPVTLRPIVKSDAD